MRSLQAFAGKQNTFLLSSTFAKKKKKKKSEAPAAYDEDDMLIYFWMHTSVNRFLCEHLDPALRKQSLHIKV